LIDGAVNTLLFERILSLTELRTLTISEIISIYYRAARYWKAKNSA
jgi:hypothetical protein